MRHVEAERYAEAVLFARGAIIRGVEAERSRMLSKSRTHMGNIIGGGERSDPTARDALKKLQPIAVLRCMDEGKTFLIQYPEKWLEVFEKAFASFKDRYGADNLELIKRRYVYGWTSVKIAEQKGVSRRAFNNQRDKFLSILLAHALQAGLLKID